MQKNFQKNIFQILWLNYLVTWTQVQKLMIPDLEITMQTDTSYAEDLLGLKFNPAKGCISETAKSVVRLGLV